MNVGLVIEFLGLVIILFLFLDFFTDMNISENGRWAIGGSMIISGLAWLKWKLG